MNENIRINFFLKIIYNFIYLIFLMSKYIKSIDINTCKDISDYEHASLYLQNENHYSIFRYNKIREETNLIIKLNTTSSYFPINIYLYNNNQINYDESSGEFKDYSKLYKQEILKENEEFEFALEPETKEYYIVFSISIFNQSYNGSFTVFQTPVDILLNDVMTYNNNFYFLYGNNYTSKSFEPKYTFRIDSNELYNKENNEIYIHCLTKSLSPKKIKIKNNDELIFSENSINNLDYYLNITKKSIYNIELIGLINDNISFSVFFEISYDRKDKMKFIGDNQSVCKYILGESTYYFYDYIKTTKSQLENSLFYVSYHSSLEKSFILEYFTVYNYTNQDELYEIALNGNYTQMKYKKEINNIIYYKYHDIYNEINNNIVIFRIKPNYSKNLNLDLFCLKKLPLIEIHSDFFEIKFSSNFILDNIGYYYLSKKSSYYNDSLSNIMLYGSNKNSFEVYEGLYDIVDNNENEKKLIANNDKFMVLNSTYIDYSIKIRNFEKINYTFQLFLTSFKNSSFYINKNDKNKEIYINNFIKEFYLINLNRDNELFILEPRVIYGHFTIKYFNLDSIGNESILNIKDIFSNDYNLEIIYNSKLTESSLELIKIINNDFNSNINFEGVIYINRYNLSDYIIKGILTPFFLHKNEKISSKFMTHYNNQTLDYIIKYDPNYPELLEENHIKVNIGKEILTLNKKNNIIKGKINTINEQTIIQFENLSNEYSFLIWIKLYISEEEEKNFSKILLSSEYYNDKIKNNGKFIFSLDWNNILNNIKLYGNKIMPNYFHCYIMGCNNINFSKGYYYQIITENNNYDFYLYNSNDTSIIYELNMNYSHNFFQTRIDIPKMNQLLNKNKIFHTVLSIQDIVPNTQISFYINYMYQEELEPNSLHLLNFTKNIYSLNLNISKPKTNKSNIFLQAIYCNNEEAPKISIFYSKKGYVNYKKHNYSFQKESKNIFYYMAKLEDTDDVNYLFEIFYPKNLFLQYYYFDDNENLDNNLNKIFNDYNYYNINIEKIGEELIVSFDSLELNTLTNYSLLIRNELDEKIINECQFLSLLSSYKPKDLIIFSAIDSGRNQRVKININIKEYGNYEVYIFAHTLNNIGRYKLLGSKSYSFIINDGGQNGSSIFVIFLIISNIILILLIIIIVICYCYKKQKKNLMNPLDNNNSNTNIKAPLLSTHSSDNNISNKIEKFDKPSSKESNDNINNEIDNNINNKISIIQESNFNILNKDAAIISGSINDEGENNDKNNSQNINNENTLEGNNDIDNKNLDEENSEGAAPAFNFMKTENPEDNKIDNIFDERNNIKDEQKDDDSIKKVFVNTDTTKG